MPGSQQLLNFEHIMPGSQQLLNHFLVWQVALEQGTISLSVGTELFKAARLSKAQSTKDANLANTPCTQNNDDYTFTVANYNDTSISSARERYLGLTNRVIAGMLLQTTRTTPVNCTDSRFSDIESLCKGGKLSWQDVTGQVFGLSCMSMSATGKATS